MTVTVIGDGDDASKNAETLLEFPCDFPIKIMGLNHENFVDVIFDLVSQHAPDFCRERLTVRPSAKGNYLALTCTVRATSKAQLDDLYRALSSHPMVKMAL